MDTRNFENVMRSTKSLQTGPGCVVLVFFFVLPTYVTNFQGQYGKVTSCRECAEVLIQLHSMQCTMQPWWNRDQTLPWKNKHYHASSCYTRANPSTHWLLRRATFASPFRCFKSKALRLWCIRRTRSVEGFSLQLSSKWASSKTSLYVSWRRCVIRGFRKRKPESRKLAFDGYTQLWKRDAQYKIPSNRPRLCCFGVFFRFAHLCH